MHCVIYYYTITFLTLLVCVFQSLFALNARGGHFGSLRAKSKSKNATFQYSWVTCFGSPRWVRMAACFSAPQIGSVVSHLRGLYLV